MKTSRSKKPFHGRKAHPHTFTPAHTQLKVTRCVNISEMLNKNLALHLIKIDSACLLLIPYTATAACSAHGHIIFLPGQKVGGGDSIQDRFVGLSLVRKCLYSCYPPPSSFGSMLSHHIWQLYLCLSDIRYLKEKKIQASIFLRYVIFQYFLGKQISEILRDKRV